MLNIYSEENRRKGNAKILNYVGYRRIGDTDYFKPDSETTNVKIHIDNAKYDISWDWLMPLYKNIASSVDNIRMKGENPGIILNKFHKLKHNIADIYPIESAWKALIEYIDEVNKQGVRKPQK
ncbi:MAG: hypothetical protein ACOC22_02925 [bacterium]